MNGTPREMPQPSSASEKSYVRPSVRSRQIRKRGHVTGAVLAGTSFPAIPSASCTSSAAVTLTSSLWLTVADGRDTGDRDSATSSNELEQPAVTVPRDNEGPNAGRSAPSR